LGKSSPCPGPAFHLQVMFVRLRSTLLAHRLPSALKAAKYSMWEAEQAAVTLDPHGSNLTSIVLGERQVTNTIAPVLTAEGLN